tara:strand:+ start:757 stop:2424 length:1668 start_codon:yes stop_codon:yes gene_type:complete
LIDGQIVASVSEERLTRRKNEVGYPSQAIEEVLRLGGIDASSLDSIEFASLFMHARDYLVEIEPWYRVGVQDQRMAQAKPRDYDKIVFERRKQERIDEVTGQLGIASDKIGFLEHHLCHVAAAYYTAPVGEQTKPVLGLTCDGAGDNLSATVSKCDGNSITRLADTGRHASLGKIYSRVTMMMGMKPWEHEYKIMGLAPYGDDQLNDRAADGLRELLKVNEEGMCFEQAGELSMNYCYFRLREIFEEVRFDVVAGAIQKFTEEMLTNWVSACIRKTGLSDIVCGGGVFMNVKANMLVANLPEVTSMYVMPSSGDESLSIGACLYRYHELISDRGSSQSSLPNLYLGAEFDKTAERKVIESKVAGLPINVDEPGDIDIATADLLSDGEIVSRCRGRMEWGARALGNRSILCTAHDARVVDKINAAIKDRDFWMPFAPSIREEDAHCYIDDPKDLHPYFMTFAFETKPEGYEHLVAASHPRDGTIRPNVVSSTSNSDYHKLLSHFRNKTGRGAILNTSFNLHGFPIVHSPADAIDVFLKSGLEYLVLNHYLLHKYRE